MPLDAAQPIGPRKMAPRNLPKIYQAVRDASAGLPEGSTRVPAGAATFRAYRFRALNGFVLCLALSVEYSIFAYQESTETWRHSGSNTYPKAAVAYGLVSMAFLAWFYVRLRKTRRGEPPFGLVLFPDDCLVDFAPRRARVIPRRGIRRFAAYAFKAGNTFVHIDGVGDEHTYLGPYDIGVAELQDLLIEWYDGGRHRTSAADERDASVPVPAPASSAS